MGSDQSKKADENPAQNEGGGPQETIEAESVQERSIAPPIPVLEPGKDLIPETKGGGDEQGHDTKMSEVAAGVKDGGDKLAAAENAVAGKVEDVVDVGSIGSDVVTRLVELYAMDWPEGVTGKTLKTGAQLDEESRGAVKGIAGAVGFDAKFDETGLVLGRRIDGRDATDRKAKALSGLTEAKGSLTREKLAALDDAVKADVEACVEGLGDLKEGERVEIDGTQFLAAPEFVRKKVKAVASRPGFALKGNVLERGAVGGKAGEPAGDDDVEEEDKMSPRVTPEGELVWRRLQHWCTNVRKEKKFNIWARGLSDEVKQKIIDIATQVGFESAIIQPNGNIHVEIKPPADKQSRKRLRRPTPEVREELIPVDKAVTESAISHMKEWIEEFVKSGKPRDTLNCRFALPADWIRRTAEELATESGLKVVQDTGIELTFTRADIPEDRLKELIQAAAEKAAAAPAKAATPREGKLSPRRNQGRGRGRGRDGGRGREGGRGRGRGRGGPGGYGHHGPYDPRNQGNPPFPYSGGRRGGRGQGRRGRGQGHYQNYYGGNFDGQGYGGDFSQGGYVDRRGMNQGYL